MQKFLARQPIFNANRVVYGYELLFRSGPENYFNSSQPEVACASTTDRLFLFGIEHLTQGRRAFINCTREFLIRDYAVMLPSDRVVLEILESVRADNEVLSACRRLKQAGYLLALDDFIDSPDSRKLLPLADFLKVDVLATTREEQLRLARDFSSQNIRLLAEKVETYEDFERAGDLGYSYFQGYFFSRPQMLSHHDIPSHKLAYLRVPQAANQSPIEMNEIAERIKTETSLSYRLLRYLNSAAFFLALEVRSISHALTLLGERGVRRWVSLVTIACMADEKPQELVTLPLIRARFCELLAPVAGVAEFANDLFLRGLVSAIDAILDMKMEDVLKELALREEIRQALLGAQNILRRVFQIVLLYEAGAWDELNHAAAALQIEEDAIPPMFFQSVDWARSILTGQPVDETEPS